MNNINFNLIPDLITKRLVLRQLQLSDANEIFLLRTDDQINAFIDRPRAIVISDATAFINKIMTLQNNSEGLMWAITYREDPKLIGTIGIWNIVKERAQAEIGYELLPQYQGKGIMLEALRSALKVAFESLKLETVVAHPRGDNLKSIRLLEKYGFINTHQTDGAYLVYKLSSNS